MVLAISGFTLCYIIASKSNIYMRVDRPIGFMLIMSDFHLIVFPNNQNLGIDNKTVLLGCLVPGLLDILYLFDISAIMLIDDNYGKHEKCSIVLIMRPTVSNNWGPIQLISVTKAQVTNHFRVHRVLYKLENPKFSCELAAILDLCQLELVTHDWFSFDRLHRPSKPKFSHQDHFAT